MATFVDQLPAPPVELMRAIGLQRLGGLATRGLLLAREPLTVSDPDRQLLDQAVEAILPACGFT